MAETDDDSLQLFENRPIRAAWDEGEEEWCFSIIDVVGALTDQPDTRRADRKQRGTALRESVTL